MGTLSCGRGALIILLISLGACGDSGEGGDGNGGNGGSPITVGSPSSTNASGGSTGGAGGNNPGPPGVDCPVECSGATAHGCLFECDASTAATTTGGTTSGGETGPSCVGDCFSSFYLGQYCFECDEQADCAADQYCFLGRDGANNARTVCRASSPSAAFRMVCTSDAECTSDKKCYADFPTDLPVYCPAADLPVIKLCKTQP